MARTSHFRDQHDELLRLATELKAMLVVSTIANDAAAARAILNRLMGKLTVHISTEDKVLYPELQASADVNLAALGRRFAKEMEGTAGQLKTFNLKWSTTSAIKASPAEFVEDTRRIVQVLADRIRRENVELYAAADRLQGRVFA